MDKLNIILTRNFVHLSQIDIKFQTPKYTGTIDISLGTSRHGNIFMMLLMETYATLFKNLNGIRLLCLVLCVRLM